MILYRGRTNNLQLNNRKRFSGGEVKCDMCGAEIEDIKHFILWCRFFQEERNENINLQRPYIEN